MALSELTHQSLVLRARDSEVDLFTDDGRDACPVLGTVEASPGAAVTSPGGRYSGAHDVGTRTGCKKISLDLPHSDDFLVTLEIKDSTHSILVKAIVPTAEWRLTASPGRYDRGSMVPFRSTVSPDDITQTRAVLKSDAGLAAERVVPVRFSGADLFVEVPTDAVPGAYPLTVTSTMTPRFLRCEGVSACKFHRPNEQPGAGVPVTVEGTFNLEIMN